MEIPISFVEESISRGDILLSEFDGIDHRKFFVCNIRFCIATMSF